MAQKRMFSLQVVDTDKFMDMSISAQALYFHLGLHGDDDGFVPSPRKIARAVGCNDDDIRILAQKGFIIPFDSGVVVITDWAINNTLKNDRYHPTIYQREKATLIQDGAGRYQLGTEMEPLCFQTGSGLEPEQNPTKLNSTEQSVSKAGKPPRSRSSDKADRRAFGHFGWVKLTDAEYSGLVHDFGEAEVKRCIAYIDESAQSTGNKNRWKDWSVVIRRCSNGRWGLSTQNAAQGAMKTAADYAADESFI